MESSTTTSKPSKSLLSQAKFSRNQLIILASTLVLFGVVVIFMARAATVTLATVEAEAMTLPTGGSIETDSTASAGRAIKLSTNGAASGQLTLPSAGGSVVVRAKGLQCSGAPQMIVKIDGVQVLSSAVGATSWTDYTVTPVNVVSGPHTLSISFENDNTQYAGNSGNIKCSRDLYVDKTTLLGEDNSTTGLTEKAQGKLATASSTYTTESGQLLQATYANDGSVTTTSTGVPSRWSSTFSDNQWWQVDLGATTTVSRVDINWEVAYASRYQIQGSNDGTNFTTLADVTNSQAGVRSTTFTEANVRYIRILGLTRGTQWGISIWEAKVYGSGSTPPPAVTASMKVPANGATVSGSIPVEATTTGSKVEFYLDGVLKTTDTTAPYCMASATASPCSNWDSRTVANGSHSIIAYGYDAAGTKSQPATSTFTVSNTVTSTGGIYWGGMLDGNDTYDFYYPGQRPGGKYPDSSIKEWADAPWDYETWNKFESNAGKTVSMLHYGQPPPWRQTTFYNGTADSITNRGAIPMMSMSTEEIPYADIINGKYDAQILAWGKNVRAWGKPFMLRFNWEMNGDWWTYTRAARANPPEFRAMWQHFHDVVSRPVAPTDGGPAGAGATNITWVWCPNVLHYDTTADGKSLIAELYPGHNYVDWTCIDGYNQAGGYASFTQIFKATYDKVNSISTGSDGKPKPMVIGETSSSEEVSGGTKATWITNTLKTELPTSFPNIKALVWFNWRIYEGYWRSWPIETSPSSQAAFSSGIGLPYYLPRIPDTSPTIDEYVAKFPKYTKIPAP